MGNMGFAKVREKAVLLYSQRASADVTEAELRIALDESLERGAAAAVATHCGLSQQYLSDVRHGKRALTDPVVDKLRKLK